MREVAAQYEKLPQQLENQAAVPAMTGRLAGKRILIVEDETTIAENLSFVIGAEGAEVIGPMATADAALNTVATTHLDGATVDIKLACQMNFSIADVLAACYIPFLFVTGYCQYIPPAYANVCRLQKPITPFIVCRTLEGVMSGTP